MVSSLFLCRSGNVYEGEWHLNERHGRGTMHWWDRGECYSGEWVGGIQHGQGEHTWLISTADNAQVSRSDTKLRDLQRSWDSLVPMSTSQIQGMVQAQQRLGSWKNQANITNISNYSEQ